VLGGRLESRRGERIAQVRFIEPDKPQTGGRGIRAEPAECKFIGSREYDQSVGCRVPVTGQVRMGDREIQRRVSRLAGLGAGREIGPGDQIEAGGRETLAVWHISMLPASRSCVT